MLVFSSHFIFHLFRQLSCTNALDFDDEMIGVVNVDCNFLLQLGSKSL
jgi:hypothetical protein